MYEVCNMENLESQEYLTQAKILIGQEKYSAAVLILEKAEECDRMNEEIYLTKGLCYANLNELDKAKAEFGKALKVNRKSGVALFHLGNICMMLGDRAEGIENYNKAIMNGYDNAQLYFTLGVIMEEEGNDENAIHNYVKAIHKDPSRPDIRVRKIRLQIKNGAAQQAMESIDEMIVACPDVFEGYHLRFLLLMEAGKLQEAEETVNGAMELFPNEVGFALDKASLMTAKKQYQQALEYLETIEKTMDVDENSRRDIALERVKIAARNADMEKTIEVLEGMKREAEKADPPKVDCEALYMLMNCYLGNKQLEKAKENAEILFNVEQLNQFSIPAWYYLPYILKNMGKEQEAKPLYEKAVEKYRNLSLKHPGNIDFYMFRILSLRDLGNYDKALELSDYLVSIQEDLAEVHTIRAAVLTAMGREEEAKAELKRSEELGGSRKRFSELTAR